MKLTITIAFGLAASLTAAAVPVYSGNTSSSETLISFPQGEIVGWANPTFPEIYQTCNQTNIRMLDAALADSLEATAYAKNRLLSYGVDDVFYKRWFGNGSVFSVIGVLDQLVEASKDGILFRCDDVDGLCAANPNYYAGHHRETAPSETVICDYFYSSRKPLSQICFEGNLVDVGPKHYSGIDLLHRYLHVPKMSLNIVGEYSEGLEEVVEMAKSNATFAVKNTDNFLYYIADVYSSTVIPGGCLGELPA